jgi:hypothetical protein
MGSQKTAVRKSAARRPEIKIDQSAIPDRDHLRHLMIIQRSVDGGCETVYRGSKADFVRAGIPAVVLDQPTLRTSYAFRLNRRDAELRRDRDRLELTLQWGSKEPWYHSEAHPALSEVARMVLIDAGAWLHDHAFSNEPTYAQVQTDRLLDDGRASDYHQPRGRKYRFDPDQLSMLTTMLLNLNARIQQSDIYLIEEPVLQKRRRPRGPSRAKLAEAAKADDQVQSFIAAAVGKATKRARPDL